MYADVVKDGGRRWRTSVQGRALDIAAVQNRSAKIQDTASLPGGAEPCGLLRFSAAFIRSSAGRHREAVLRPRRRNSVCTSGPWFNPTRTDSMRAGTRSLRSRGAIPALQEIHGTHLPAREYLPGWGPCRGRSTRIRRCVIRLRCERWLPLVHLWGESPSIRTRHF